MAGCSRASENTNLYQSTPWRKGKKKKEKKNITIVSTYAPNIGAQKYIRKILEDFNKAIESNSLTLGDFNTLLQTMDRSSKQNINKYIVELKDTLDQMDLMDICRNFHSKEAKYTFFPNAHGNFSKIDHIIGHKKSLQKFK